MSRAELRSVVVHWDVDAMIEALMVCAVFTFGQPAECTPVCNEQDAGWMMNIWKRQDTDLDANAHLRGAPYIHSVQRSDYCWKSDGIEIGRWHRVGIDDDDK
jgi:hypothetical protein